MKPGSVIILIAGLSLVGIAVGLLDEPMRQLMEWNKIVGYCASAGILIVGFIVPVGIARTWNRKMSCANQAMQSKETHPFGITPFVVPLMGMLLLAVVAIGTYFVVNTAIRWLHYFVK